MNYTLKYLPRRGDCEDIVVTTPEGNKIHSRFSGVECMLTSQVEIEKRAVDRALGLPLWLRMPQPPRQYVGPVSPIPSRALGIKDACRVTQWFVCDSEGAEYQFVDVNEWERLRPLVPIYGELVGNKMLIWDRIVDEHWPERGGFRENDAHGEWLAWYGFNKRQQFYGKSIADILGDVQKKVDEETGIHVVRAEPTPATKMADENRRREHKYLTENMLKKALMEAFKGEPKYFPKVNIQVSGRQAGKTVARHHDALRRAIDDALAGRPLGPVWIDEVAKPFTEDEWKNLKPPPKFDHRFWGMDLGSKDAFAVVAGSWIDGKMVVEDIATADLPAPATPEAPAKPLHHNQGFFPNKVGRIDVLPRYPGVWG